MAGANHRIAHPPATTHASAFSPGMLGEFETAVTQGDFPRGVIDGHGYRYLLREAGLVGQAVRSKRFSLMACQMQELNGSELVHPQPVV